MTKKVAWKDSYRGRWRKRNPWARYVEWARRRCACTDPKKWWPFYGAKGIQVRLNAKDLQVIWFRDEAFKLKKPSLDRINPDKDYTPDNVRFIEFKLNSRLAWDYTKKTGYAEQAPEFT